MTKRDLSLDEREIQTLLNLAQYGINCLMSDVAMQCQSQQFAEQLAAQEAAKNSRKRKPKQVKGDDDGTSASK